jgi:acid phosphatase type 7
VRTATTGLVVVGVATAVVVGSILVVTRPQERSAEPPTRSERDGVEVVLAAGDIASCDTDDDSLVAEILDANEGTILTLGDNAYPSGREEDLAACYDPTWGRHLARTRPALGNHDFDADPEADPYFAYFGDRAGERGEGYYGFELGPYWYVVVLNSNCEHVDGGCDAGSPQERWLRAELARHDDRNVLAVWHHARFSTGEHGDADRGRPFFEALHGAEAELVLVAHDHHYERFARVDPEGRPDEVRGIRQFVVGTGGGDLRGYGEPARSITEARMEGTYGLLRLELARDAYRWRFIPVAGETFSDRGEARVNGQVPSSSPRHE